MTVEFHGASGADTLLVNKAPAPAMLARVSKCLDLVAGKERPSAKVSSEANFPIGAGLASSASAFAALVVAAANAAGRELDLLSMARLAGSTSGSAARSLYGGIVELDAAENDISLRPLLDKDQWPLEVVVAVTASGAKPIGSGEAMIRSEKSSPFYSGWLERQNDDLQAARTAVQERDFLLLGSIAEHNCLKMHSVMWTSRPPIVYWNSGTLTVLETIRALQREGHGVFFTIDAGPQVKAICLPESVDAVIDALRGTPFVLDLLQSRLGDGAKLIDAA